MNMTHQQRTGVIILATIVLTALAIYLTPLKHFDLIAPTMNEIDPKAAYTDMQQQPNDYLFIDVRDPSVYVAAHAQGAINMPIATLTTEHYTLPMSGKKIVLICTTGQLAAVAYGYLQNWGFQNLLHITGGLNNWNNEGLPIEGTSVVNGVDTASMVPDGASSDGT